MRALFPTLSRSRNSNFVTDLFCLTPAGWKTGSRFFWKRSLPLFYRASETLTSLLIFFCLTPAGWKTAKALFLETLVTFVLSRFRNEKPQKHFFWKRSIGN
ncbi:MAG: hypothetical protein L3J21_03340 [Devosiaceae bacterium]|nr:hypothetical protein [Devosiaceae bacterium]